MATNCNWSIASHWLKLLYVSTLTTENRFGPTRGVNRKIRGCRPRQVCSWCDCLAHLTFTFTSGMVLPRLERVQSVQNCGLHAGLLSQQKFIRLRALRGGLSAGRMAALAAPGQHKESKHSLLPARAKIRHILNLVCLSGGIRGASNGKPSDHQSTPTNSASIDACFGHGTLPVWRLFGSSNFMAAYTCQHCNPQTLGALRGAIASNEQDIKCRVISQI